MKIKNKDIHIHAITVHFTNALYPVATFFMFLSLLSNNESFRHTYYYILVLATISVPFSYLTGIIEWRQKYKGVWVRIFVSKVKYGLLLFLIGGCCTIWYLVFPEVFEDGGISRIVFIMLNSATIPLVIYLGYLGGKLVFGGPH